MTITRQESGPDRKSTGRPSRIESLTEALDRRAFLLQLLDRTRDGKPIGLNIRECGLDGHRCRVETCPICLRELRLTLIDWGVGLMDGSAGHPTWTAASIIPANLRVPKGSLYTLNLRTIVNTTLARLSRSAIADRRLIGGIDLSLNLQDNLDPTWQPHLYLLIEGSQTRDLKGAIRRAFPPEPTALRPYHFRDLTDPPAAISYAYKAIFFRRSSFATSKGDQRTKSQALKRDEIHELATFLSDYRTGARLILRGLRRPTIRVDEEIRRRRYWTMKAHRN